MGISFALLLAYPFIPGLNESVRGVLETSLGDRLTELFIYGILALGLHLVVGNAGMFHLGIGASFGIGAFVTGILMVKVPAYPFQIQFIPAMLLAGVASAIVGILLAAPTLRLRGDYLALVTLGFGEVIRFTLRNLQEITGGTRPLTPVPPPSLPGIDDNAWRGEFEPFYLFCLAFLILTWVLITNLERSRLGRAWVALREDELAASCMGINTARLKLAAFALGSFIAGGTGAIIALKQGTTGDPDFYGFNISINVLSCLILGGLGNRNGVLLGVVLIFGFDKIFADVADKFIQRNLATTSPFLQFGFWKMFAFGLVLVLVMRFRPSGLLSASREKAAPPAAAGGSSS